MIRYLRWKNRDSVRNKRKQKLQIAKYQTTITQTSVLNWNLFRIFPLKIRTDHQALWNRRFGGTQIICPPKYYARYFSLPAMRDLCHFLSRKYLVNQALTRSKINVLYSISKVCKIWRDVSLDPLLWENVDLSNCVKERYKTDVRLHWFIHNRLATCQDLNLSMTRNSVSICI